MSEPTVLIGATERIFADDHVGVCARCGTPVFNRPHSPTHLIRWCTPCWLARPEVADDTIYISEQSRREVALYGMRVGRTQ